MSFRYFTQKLSRDLGVNGEVYNRTDGAVQIEAEGEEEKLQKLLSWCQTGPERANIDRIEKHYGDVQGYTDFRIG